MVGNISLTLHRKELRQKEVIKLAQIHIANPWSDQSTQPFHLRDIQQQDDCLCQCVSEQLLHFVQTNTDSIIFLRIKISPTKPLNVVIWMHSCCLNEMGLHCYFPKQNCNVSWIPAISTLIWGAATPDLRFNFRYSEPNHILSKHTPVILCANGHRITSSHL